MLDRKVAVKVLSGPALSAEGRARLLRESQAAFEEMGIPRYAAVVRNRLQELGATEEPASPAP